MNSNEMKVTDILRFIAGIADTDKLKISGVLIATATLLENVISSPGGTSLGTRKCEVCTFTWNIHDTWDIHDATSNHPQHYRHCAVTALEQEIFKVMTQK